MKKNTFYALSFCATLGSCAYVEGIGSNTEETAQAEAESVLSAYRESDTDTPTTDAEIYEDLIKNNPNATDQEIEALTFSQTAYSVILADERILIIDGNHKIIHSENYDSGSSLVKAILTDNQ